MDLDKEIEIKLGLYLDSIYDMLNIPYALFWTHSQIDM